MPTARGTSRPGRVIAAAAAVVLVIAALIAAIDLAGDEQAPLATNGVGVGAVITAIDAPGDRLCLSDVVVPAGARSLELWLGFHDPAAKVFLEGELALRGGATVAVPRTQVAVAAGFQAFPLAHEITREQRGRLCVVRRGEGPQVDVAGASVVRRAGERPATLNGDSLAGVEPSLRFPDVVASGLSRIGPGIERLAALSPSGFPPALIAVILFGVVPGALVLLLWNLATAPRRSARRVAALCGVASLGITVGWATITPVFQGPDEPEHFAYAQHVAFTGERAAPSRLSPLPPYSTQVAAAMSVSRNNAVAIEPGARQPWTQTTRRDLNDIDDLPRDDGGGYTDSASGHSAFYYTLLAPALKLGGGSFAAQLYVARLVNAVFMALVTVLAAWAALLIVPGRRRVAALAGLAAATLPIAGAVGGTVNSDVLLNLVAAAAFVAVLAVLRDARGSARRFALAGALIILIPITKISGTGVAVAFAGALMIATALRWRDGLGAVLLAALAAIGGVVATLAVLALAAVTLVDGQTLTLFNVHPQVPGDVVLPMTHLQQLDYVIQTFVPFIHLDGDHFPSVIPLERIYVVGTWGGFGWNRLYLPTMLNTALAWGTVAGGVAGFVALWRHRRYWLAGRRLAILAVALTPLIAIAFVAAVYAVPGGRAVQPEQGRYLLVALVPVALWFAAVPGSLPPGRARQVLTGTIAGGLCAATGIGMLVATSGWAS